MSFVVALKCAYRTYSPFTFLQSNALWPFLARTPTEQNTHGTSVANFIGSDLPLFIQLIRTVFTFLDKPFDCVNAIFCSSSLPLAIFVGRFGVSFELHQYTMHPLYVLRGCTFQHFSQMHSDGFSSIACAMLATTICFPSSLVHTCSTCNMTFNNRFNWFTIRIQIAYEGIWVCFKCKQELHVCKHIRSLSLDHRHRIHLECTLGLGGSKSIQMMCMIANKKTEAMQAKSTAEQKTANRIYGTTTYYDSLNMQSLYTCIHCFICIVNQSNRYR